jgi:hypothetical protein
MTLRNGLNFATALFFAGLFSVVTGLLFAVPMAVQPMKAIAAIAITQGLTTQQIVAAGAIVSLLVLLLGLLGLVNLFNRLVPTPVICGIQMAVGLSLAFKGVGMVAGTGLWLGTDSYAIGIIAALIVILLAGSRRVPAALLLFGAGLILAAARSPQAYHALGLGVTLPTFSLPDWHDYPSAFTRAALPQLPLTILNSVIAVCALSDTLFPERKVSPRRVAISVGMMNLVGMWFGAMPMCHGAGGLAGQYRFGARTNGSILFLGVAKIVLAVLFGSSLLALAMAFPMSILGVMLAASGIELAGSVRSHINAESWPAMLCTVAACLGLDSIAVGLIIGLACYWLVRLAGRQGENTAA